MTVSKDIPICQKRPEDGFPHHIMTDDETLIYSSEQKSKLVSKLWLQDGSEHKKNYIETF